MQSDKASVEITSRFAGVVKKLYYEAGEMARVGKPFVDIDIQGDSSDALEPAEPPPQSPKDDAVLAEAGAALGEHTAAGAAVEWGRGSNSSAPSAQQQQQQPPSPPPPRPGGGKHAALATPAVRHLSKELDVDITHVAGTGKDGRVLKEDIYKFVAAKGSATAGDAAPSTEATGSAAARTAGGRLQQEETRVQMNKTQEMMFKTMTRSLAIPHFLYADEIDFTALVELRARLNQVLAKSPPNQASPATAAVGKLSFLPFILKAVSLALYQYPILNARVDHAAADPAATKPQPPTLVLRRQHNIGIAMDTPAGLVVPVVRNVQDRTVVGVAAELARLQDLARAGRLRPDDMAGGTITVSNIGSIGGTYLSPVVVEPEVAILGIGRVRTVPAFRQEDGEGEGPGEVVRKRVCNFSWSADHRVVDGATLARAAQVVRTIVEEPDVMLMHLR